MSDGKPIELAQAYVSVALSTKGVGKQLVGMFRPAATEAQRTGQDAGKKFASGFKGASKGATAAAADEQKKLAAAAEAASKRVKTAKRMEGDANRKVRIEEAKLNELRATGRAKQSQLLAAEDRLTKARQNAALATDKVSDETRQLDQAQDALKKSTNQATTAQGRFRDKLRAGMSGLNPFRKLENDAKESGRRSSRGFSGGFKSALGGAIGALGIAGLLSSGVGAAKSLITNSVGEAREAQKVSATTQQIIKSTGRSANISAAGVSKLAEAISLKTGVDDEAIQSGANLLLTFKQVRNEAGKGNDIFNRTTKAALDLSKAGFGSMSSTSKMLGKALNDPVKGLSALSRAGVTFSASQKKRIEQYVKEGKTLEAQKFILGEVESQVGGVAAKTATAGEKMRVAWGNAQEKLGTALLPTIDKLANGLTNHVIPGFVKFIGWAERGGGKLSAFLGKFSKTDGVKKLAGDFRAGLGEAQAILGNFVAAGREIWSRYGEQIKGIGRGLMTVIGGIFRGGMKVLRGITDVALGLLRGDWKKFGGGLKGIASGLFTALKGVFKGGFSILRNVASIGWNAIKTAFAKPVNWVIDNVLNKLIGGYNKVAKAVKAPQIGLIGHVYASGGTSSSGKGNSKNSNLYKATGGVLPGYTPGRDVHHFYSPTGGGLHLSGGEAIMRPEWVRAIGGKREVDRQNRAARTGQAFATGGIFVWPTNSRRLSGNYAGHSGVDIAVPTGSPMYATADGRITYTGWGKGYGNAVFATLGGVPWVYGHGSKPLVPAGRSVKRGQVIGLTGNTGNSTGPHLHIEASRSGGFGSVANRAYTLGLLSGSTVPKGGAVPDPGPSALERIKNAIAGPFRTLATMGSHPFGKWIKGLIGMLKGPMVSRFRGYADGTSSAAEGPAWLAERGPEIVSTKGIYPMRGGETVTPLDQWMRGMQIRVYIGDKELTDIVDVRIEEHGETDNRRARAGMR